MERAPKQIRTMKAMSKAELELEKHISKLEGELASAQYALNMMRYGWAQMPPQRSARRIMQLNGAAIVQNHSKEIPLFS